MQLHVECSMAMFANGLQCCDGLLSVFYNNGFPKAPDHCIQNVPKQWSMQQQIIDIHIHIHGNMHIHYFMYEVTGYTATIEFIQCS